MTKPAWDESRKFYASRLPHDWWARVLKRSLWAQQNVVVTSPGAFPFAAQEVCGVNPKRVAVKFGCANNSIFLVGSGPFGQSAAGVLNAGAAWQFAIGIYHPPFCLLDIGRGVQSSWFASPFAIGASLPIYVGELLCDIDPFDFDALYGD